MSALQFIGEYNCTIDGKGRMVLPTGLRKQLPVDNNGKFVINRGFEKHLVLWPEAEWQTTTEQVNQLNTYVKENREFLRYFYRGATELELDAAARILMPKSLLEYANIIKDTILLAYSNRIEVWSEEVYNKMLEQEPESFSELAERVMGKQEGDGPLWMRN